MDCDELIDELMSVIDPQGQRQGAGLAEGAPPAAAPAATPDAPQEDEWVQKHRERLAAIAAGGQAWQYGLVVRGKAFTADRIDALDNSEIEALRPLRSKAWGGDDEDAGVCGAPALCGDRGHVSPDRKPAKAHRRTRGRSLCRTRA